MMGRGRRLAAAFGAIVVVATAISACGSSSGAPSPAEVAATTAASTPPPPGRLAKSAVRSYYRDVNEGSFGEAWSHFSPALRRSLGGFSPWRSGYDQTTHTTLVSVRTVSANASAAIERVRLIGDAIDACGDAVSQSFAGTWTLESRGDEFVGVALDASQVGGDELITDPADCAPPPSTTPPAAPPVPADNCDPNYVGACVPADASDVDCAGGSGDGPEYVGPVQVVGSDPYGLDADGDGYACES
jgi:hypothetical protein